MTFKAQGSTREQFLSSGNGWTDELLIQHGYMNAPTHPGILTH
jgi:hypothetical protein